jgi:glycerol-3-phosphate acyltransferase PlsX
LKIAVDAMGGDHAPQAIVEGALQAAQSIPHVHIYLVGDEKQIKQYMMEDCPPNIEIIHTTEVIEADEEPVRAIRRKKDSSMVVALEMTEKQEADVVISAGNTGAFMSGGIFITKRIDQIERPALAPILPSIHGTGTLLLDVGANMDAKPEHLLQYALMGNVYANKVMNVPVPRIGLLNVGTEANKGSEVTKKAYTLLSDQSFHFVGNVEARDIPYGVCDVVVCDGFSGNILLKTMEGLASAIFEIMKQEFTESVWRKLGAAILKPGLRKMKKKLDYTEYGGAPLLGLQGACIKAHGSSNAVAIKNAIFQAVRFVEKDVIGQISEEIKRESGKTNG